MNETIATAFCDVARGRPDQKLYFADGGQGRSYTYQEVLSKVQLIAAGLRSQGRVDRYGIGLMAENRPEWAIAYLAIIAAGATVVPIDIHLKENEVSYIIENSRIKTVLASSPAYELLKKIDSNIETFVFEKDHERSWSRLITELGLDDFPTDNDLAVLIYTSGTTGAPKAVELTHENILSNVRGVQELLEIIETDKFLSVLPLHHTFEATAGFLLPSLSGASVIYARSLKSRDILEDIKNNQITIMIGVPLLFEKMNHSFAKKLASAPVARRLLFKTLFSISSVAWKMNWKLGKTLFRSVRTKAGLESIHIFCSGGAPLPPKISRFFNLIGFDFLQGYGMTETSPVTTVHSLQNIKFGSVGTPLPGVELKIHQPNEQGIGEVITRGPNNTRGYQNNPKQTAELIRDGWLYTGDLGQILGNHLYITGRQKNVIVSASGKNIYPEELEERLLESELIIEAVVFGRKKENKQGEQVRAIIVPDMDFISEENNLSSNESDMSQFCKLINQIVADVNSRVADYKRIAEFDVQLEELEKTSTRKVKRFVYK